MMKQGHDTVNLQRGITTGGNTYTTVALRVVPYITEQQIKQAAEVLKRTPDGEWINVASQEQYTQLMMVAGIDGLSNGMGKTLQADLARAAFAEGDGLHAFDAKRIEEQQHVLNVIDMAEFGMIDRETLAGFLNGQLELQTETNDEEDILQKRDTTGAAQRPHQTANPAPAGGLQLEADDGYEQG